MFHVVYSPFYPLTNGRHSKASLQAQTDAPGLKARSASFCTTPWTCKPGASIRVRARSSASKGIRPQGSAAPGMLSWRRAHISGDDDGPLVQTTSCIKARPTPGASYGSKTCPPVTWSITSRRTPPVPHHTTPKDNHHYKYGTHIMRLVAFAPLRRPLRLCFTDRHTHTHVSHAHTP